MHYPVTTTTLPRRTRRPFSPTALRRIEIGLLLSLFPSTLQAASTQAIVSPASLWQQFVQGFFEHLGALLIATIAGVLAYLELRAHRVTRQQELAHQLQVTAKHLELQEKRFEAEKAEREQLARFRALESKRFREPAREIAEYISRLLVDEPQWAHRALEAAKLLPYANSLFGERARHFREEKEELASRFSTPLLNRCANLAHDGRHVVLLIDAGTTLYPFFERIGRETVKRFQQGEEWLARFHLATNNLPGLEQLILNGKRAPWDRYSKLAIEDCHILPGVPIPIFGAVAGEETNAAITRLRKRYVERHGTGKVTVISLVVGNWVRVRGTNPKCPIPMARGAEHLGVKQTLVANADEIFVVAPLGKIFLGHSKDQVNEALGFGPEIHDQDKAPYDEVSIDSSKARVVKLVTTTRAEARLLHRHSNRVEDALTVAGRRLGITEDFAEAPIQKLPHIFFPFSALPQSRIEEFLVEFPHEHTQANNRVLEMFDVNPRDL